MCDINITTRDIILYFKHLMCDAQQKKAKLFGFDWLGDQTWLWLKDFQSDDIAYKFQKRVERIF